jgi:hypothetical protein
MIANAISHVLSNLQVPYTPYQSQMAMAIDFVGLLLEDDGFNCIVTMTDRLGADIRIALTRTDIIGGICHHFL